MLGLHPELECLAPTLLFNFGDLRFCLPAAQIEAITQPEEMTANATLPDIFSGFVNYQSSLIPCVSLIALLGLPASRQFFGPQRAIILRAQATGRNPCLAIQIDHLVASLVAKEDSLYPLRQQFEVISWLGYELVFADQSFVGVDHLRLLQTIERRLIEVCTNERSVSPDALT